MTDPKKPIYEWIPYLVDEEGWRTTRLVLSEKFFTIPQIQRFFHNLPHTHPQLVGKRIDFEEQTDRPALFVVPSIYGSKGD
jgi:hypothetical protein